MDEVSSAWQQLRKGTISLEQALAQLVDRQQQINLHLIDPEIVKRFTDSVRKIFRKEAYLPPVVPLLLWQNRYYLGSPLGLSATEVRDLQQLLKTDITVMPISEKSYRNWFRCFHVKEILQNLDPVYVSLLSDVENEQDMAEAAEASLTFARNQTDRIHNLITQAIALRASDIHLEPILAGLAVRFRIDGILRDITVLPQEIGRKIVVAVKVMSDMNIAETRRPQDGRIREDFSIGLQEMEVAIRVSTLPCVVPRTDRPSEKVVMRLLRQKNSFAAIEDLGFNDASCAVYKRWVRQPQGVIIFTGPTGSGKTSTLYTTLQTVATREKNISTIEDPVEYSIPGVTQTQVLEVAGMTFASGLRSILRQDPDIVMVGEIRDADTAITAIRAALTGHLVLTTLHANDALGAIPRLKNLGVEPGLISDALLGIVSQRLIRRVCPYCGEAYLPTRSEKELFQLTDEQILSWNWRHGRGCVKCFSSGYLEREGIFEILSMDDYVRSAIHNDSMEDLRDYLNENSELSFRAAALDKVREGKTDLAEILRVLPESSVTIRKKVRVKSTEPTIQITADFIGLTAKEQNLNADFVNFSSAEGNISLPTTPQAEEYFDVIGGSVTRDQDLESIASLWDEEFEPSVSTSEETLLEENNIPDPFFNVTNPESLELTEVIPTELEIDNDQGFDSFPLDLVPTNELNSNGNNQLFFSEEYTITDQEFAAMDRQDFPEEFTSNQEFSESQQEDFAEVSNYQEFAVANTEDFFPELEYSPEFPDVDIEESSSQHSDDQEFAPVEEFYDAEVIELSDDREAFDIYEPLEFTEELPIINTDSNNYIGSLEESLDQETIDLSLSESTLLPAQNYAIAKAIQIDDETPNSENFTEQDTPLSQDNVSAGNDYSASYFSDVSNLIDWELLADSPDFIGSSSKSVSFSEPNWKSISQEPQEFLTTDDLLEMLDFSPTVELSPIESFYEKEGTVLVFQGEEATQNSLISTYPKSSIFTKSEVEEASFFVDFTEEQVQEIFHNQNETEQEAEEFTPDYNSLLEHLVYSLEAVHDRATCQRMRKLLIAACTGNWPNSYQDTNMVSFYFLIEKIMQLYPKFTGLESCLRLIVCNLNKSDVYAEVADLLLKSLKEIYQLQDWYQLTPSKDFTKYQDF